MTNSEAAVTVSGAIAVALPFISACRISHVHLKILSPAKTAVGISILLLIGVFVVPGLLFGSLLMFIVGAPLIGLVGNALLAIYFRLSTLEARERRFWFIAHSGAFSLLMFLCIWYRTFIIPASM